MGQSALVETLSKGGQSPFIVVVAVPVRRLGHRGCAARSHRTIWRIDISARLLRYLSVTGFVGPLCWGTYLPTSVHVYFTRGLRVCHWSFLEAIAARRHRFRPC